jgi:signal transduction histidine kinase
MSIRPMALLSFILVSALSAQADLAQALVKEGADYLKANGREAFLRQVNLGSGRFHVKSGSELYLFVYDEKGTCLAHGFNLKNVGGNRWNAKDPDGKLYVQDYLGQAKAKGSAWVNYKMTDPVNGKIEAKTSFVQMVEGLCIGCGIYKR